MHPSDRVGSEAYLATLAERLTACEFPHPDPEAVPALTEARYVIEAAEDAGDDDYATAVRALSEPVLAPLGEYQSTMADLRADDPDDPEAALEERLDRRTRTFLDYPAPPHDFAEGAEATGRELVEDDVDAAETDHERERRRVRAVVLGARETTTTYLDEVGFENGRPDDERFDRREFAVTYASPTAYVDTVACNIGLAAEMWLAREGHIPRAP